MFTSFDSIPQILAILFPWLIVTFIWWKYFRVYAVVASMTNKHSDKPNSGKDEEDKKTADGNWFRVWADPQNLWNALRGATTAVLEIVAVVAISEFVFLLAASGKVGGDSATTFFGMVTGFLIASAANRAPKIKRG